MPPKPSSPDPSTSLKMSLLGSKGQSDGTSIQIRTLAHNYAKMTGLGPKAALAKVRVKLREAGIRTDDRGKPLYGSNKVPIAAAFEALGMTGDERTATIPPPEGTSTSTPAPSAQAQARTNPAAQPLSALSARSATSPPAFSPTALQSAAAGVAPGVLLPVPTGAGSGNEDDPLPEGIEEVAYDGSMGPFPMPPAERAENFYFPININPDRQAMFIAKGYRAVTDQTHIREIYPDGTWKRLMRPTGRLGFHDLELFFIPRRILDYRRKRRNAVRAERMASRTDTHRANMEDVQRGLRDRLGPDAAAHIAFYSEDAATSADRAEFNRAKRAAAEGRAPDPTRARAFVGKAAGAPKE